MEIQILQLPSLVLSLSLFFSVCILFKLHHRFKQNKSAVNLPPGPWKLPIIGNIHNLVGSVPHRVLQKLSSKYGEVMHLQIGELSVVVISSPEAAKLVMKTHDVNFASRPSILAAEITGGCTGITFAPYGEYWRQLRKICTSELLSAKRVQSFRPIREQVFRDLATWITSNEGLPINLTERLYSVTYAGVSMAALGRKTKEQDVLVSVLKEVIHLASGFNIADLYPSIKLLQTISCLRPRLERLHRKTDKMLEDIIHEHKVAYSVTKTDDHSEKHEDLVDVLLKFQDERSDHSLTTDNIKSVINDVLAAGSETSATTLDWAMAEMLRNPKVLEKAHDEVRRTFDAKGCVDESCIHELKYVKSVIKETLRLHPPVPLLLPRKCGEKCEINGFEIPAGTKIIVNAWAINRDSKYWKDGDCFEPERFLDSTVDYKGNNFEYIPFGAGRRICPGISFGLANVELPLAMFLYHFDWKLQDGVKHGEMDMTEGLGATARRRKDLWVIPVLKRTLLAK